MNMPLTITTVMRHAEMYHGEREVVSATSEQDVQRASYSDVFRRARRLFNALQTLGCSPGDRIATLAWNHQQHLELYYGVICGGYVLHTINPRLFEDQIAVGDVVSVGGYTGVVQGLTVRTISLRDLHGRVHVVPFGAVTDVTNFTKEFSYAVIDAGIAYRENTDDVTQLLEEIGAELREDPDFADDLPEPLEVLGVQELADSAVVVRVRLKTSPGRQWAVSREFNRRMKRKFDDHGIEIPFPHQTIYFGEDKDAQAPPLRVSRHRGDHAKPSSGIVPEPSQRRAADVPDGSND